MPLWRSAPPQSTRSLDPATSSLTASVDGGERRGAGRVDGVVGAAEVEPVGDPAGDHVGEHAGERVLGQRRQELVQLRREVADVLSPERAEREVARQVAACLGAEDDRGALAVERPLEVAGVGERPTGDLERQQLDRLDRRERERRDAEAEGVERNRVEEAAPLRGDVVGRRCRQGR